LEDFTYWFGRSQTLLENEKIDFLESSKQAELLNRVKQAQKEVNTTQLLLKVTEGQVGVETEVLMPWHRLLMECWQVAVRFRTERSSQGGLESER